MSSPDLLSSILGDAPTNRGVLGVPFNSADASAADVAVSDAPGAGLFLVLDELRISVGATALTVTIKEETSGTVIHGPLYMAANSNYQLQQRGKGKKLATAAKKLTVRTSAAGNVTVDAGYHFE